MQTERQWRYLAEDEQGLIVKGALAADDIHKALDRLGEQGLAPITLEEDRQRTQTIFGLLRASQSLSQNDLAQFCTRMADLLQAGVTAPKALTLIVGQTRRKNLKQFAERLNRQIRKGETFSTALANDPSAPPRLMISLAASGEALGDLGAQFSRLASSFEARAALRKDLISQLIYPAALFVLIILTMIFLSFFVLPQFETVFLTANASPPAETRFVLAAGAFIRDYWLLATFVLVGLIAAVRLFIKRNRRQWENFVLNAPVAGPMVRKIETARYCRSLGELLTGGMPLARALPIAGTAITNSRVRDGAAAIEVDVRNGAPLSKAATAASCFYEEAVSFFELGEETGELGRMIEKAADYLEQQITTTLKRFTALSGPIMTAIMGLLTAGVIAAVMSGVMSLNEAVY